VYLRGLRLAQAGDPDAARRLWQALIVAFGEVKSEARWVELAQAGLEALKKPEARGHRELPDRAALDAALARAKSLAKSGQTAEAVKIFAALEDLFRDDPGLLDAIHSARGVN
jgi:hypothetical protein